jgi:hypothetical protein
VVRLETTTLLENESFRYRSLIFIFKHTSFLFGCFLLIMGIKKLPSERGFFSYMKTLKVMKNTLLSNNYDLIYLSLLGKNDLTLEKNFCDC